jgi:hypothetical protein
LKYGGESGIRTHVRVSPKHAFQACAFSHSAISPAQVGTGVIIQADGDEGGCLAERSMAVDELIESLADYPAAANFANTHELIFSVLAACGHAAAEDAFKAIFVNHRSYCILAFFVQ